MKKFLMYCGLYILITFSTAFGVVLVTKPTSATNNVITNEDNTQQESTALTRIVDNFSNVQSMQVNANVNLTTDGKNINVNAVVGVDLSKGLENFSINAIADIDIDGQKINANITYIDKQLYLSALNGNYKIETTNLISSIKQIFTLLNVKMPDLGIDIENMDTNSMLALLDDMKEEKKETETIITINLPMIGAVTLTCDLNYAIKNISIPTTTIKGMTLGVNANVDYPKDYTVKVPETNNIDLTHVFNLAEGLINYIKNDMLGLNASIEYKGNVYDVEIVLDLVNKNLKLSTIYEDYPISIYYIDNTLYIEASNLYLKFDISNIDNIVDLLKNQFNIDLPMDKIAGIMQMIKEKSINLDQFNLGKLDLSNIDLSILENFEYNNGTYKINIKDICSLDIVFKDHNFSSVKLNSKYANANIQSFEPNKIELSKSKETYADINLLIPVVNAGINTSKLTNHYGTVALTYNQYNFNINYHINLDDGIKNLKATLDTTIYDIPVNITILNQKLYLNVMDVNIVAGLSDIDLIKQFILEKFKIEIPEISNEETITKVIDKAKEILNDPTLIINYLASTDTGIKLNILNKYDITVDYNENIEGLTFKYDNIAIDLRLTSNNDNYLPTVDDDKYVTINQLLTLEENIENYVKAGKYYFDITANYKDYYVNGYVGYENNGNDYLSNITLSLSTTLLGKDIKVSMINKVVYAEIDGLNLKFELDNLNQILDFVEKNFNIKVDINSLISQIKDKTKDIDIKQIIAGINVALTKDNIRATLNDIAINIGFNDCKLSTLDLSYNDIVANIDVINQPKEITLQDSYFEISDLLPLANSVINTINCGKYEGQINITYNSHVITLNYKVQSNPFIIYITTRILGINVGIYYEDNNVYVMIDELYFKVTMEDIDYILQILKDNFDIDINKEELINKIKNIDINELANKINLRDIKDLYADNHNFRVNAYGVKVNIAFDELINTLLVKYNDIKVEANLTNVNDSVIIPKVNKKIFENVNYLVELITNTYNSLNEKQVYLNGNVQIKDFNLPITAYVDFNEDIKLSANTNVLGKDINLNMLNNVLYADIDGFKAYLNLDDIDNIINTIESTFGYKLDKNQLSLNNILKKLLIKKITKETYNNNYSIIVVVNYDGKEFTLKANFSNDNKLTGVQITLDEIVVDMLASFDKSIDISIQPDSYTTNINDLSGLINPVYNIINSKSLTMSGKVKLDLLGAQHTIDVNNISINYSDINNIVVNANVTLYNQTIDVIFSEKTLYVKVDDLSAYIKIDEIGQLIDWINTTFNLTGDKAISNIDLDNLSIDKDTLTDMLSKFVLGEKLKSIERTMNGLMINLNSYQKTENDIVKEYSQEIVIDYDKTLSQIIINLEKVYAELKINTYSDNREIKIDTQSYTHYTKYTNIVSNVYNYVLSKQYSLKATTDVYNGNKIRFTGNIDLDVNILDGLKLQGNASLKGEKDITLDLNYWNKYLYVNYNNLKLKMCENDLKEVMVIGLNLLGVDPNLIPFLNDSVENLDDIDFSSLGTLVPKLDMSNPLGLLTIINNISFTNDTLTIVIDGSQISENPNAKAMTLVIKFVNDNINCLTLNNIFTGATANEYFNLNIDFKDTPTVEAVNDSGYIDISGTNEFIKGIINTAELNYYEINGNLNINGKLIGININWNVPLNVKVKLDENRIPELMMTIGEIPTMVGVNNDVPYEFGDTESGSGRMLYVYYKDHNVYFYRTEYVNIMFGAGKRKYEKKLMVDIDEVLNNPLTYLQYGVGFTDTIIEQIQKSLDKSKGHTPNLGNIINQFTVSTDRNNLTVVLNMHEITNDELMGDMTIGLGIVNNDSTNNKNYIGKATFGLNMPLADVFTLNLKSNDLQLVNIGKTLDFNALYNYINSYGYGKGESWEASKGKWSKSSEIVHTIKFVTNCDTQLSDISAKPDTPITLPTFTEPIVIDDGEKVITRTFLGWCTDSEFKLGSEYTTTKMPSKNMTLYGKWYEQIVYYRYINFVTNSTDNIASIKALEGSTITLPTLGQKRETVGNITTTYQFTGWYTDETTHNAFNGSTMPITDTTLYAGWKVIKVEETRKLSVYDNGALLYSNQVKVDERIDLSSIDVITENTRLYTDSSYNTLYDNSYIMPHNDLILYVRNQYTLNVVSKHGAVFNRTYTLWQGEEIGHLITNQQQTEIVDDGTKTAQYTYTFNGYDNYTTTMPNNNLSIVANWTESIKYYYTVTFNTDLKYVPKSCVDGSKYKTAPGNVQALRLLDGTTFTTNNNLTCQVWATAIAWGASYNYTCSGWSTSVPKRHTNGGGDSTFTINGSDMTLYVVWKKK